MKYDAKQQQLFTDEFIGGLSLERNLGTRTLKAYQSDISCMMKWIDIANFSEFNSSTVTLYFSYLQNEIGLNARSIRRKYTSIGQYCSFLSRKYSPGEYFLPFSSRRFQLPKTLPRTLRGDEIKKLLTVIRSEYINSPSDYCRRLRIRDLCIIELLFCLGLRIGEICAMNLSDYNSEDNTVLIHGKGKKERILFISSQDVIQELKFWLQVRSEMDPQDSALFISRLGRRMSIYSIENVFYKYRDMAQINPLSTPHFLRHSFATELLNNGAGIRDVQELMGHNSIVTTQIYTEVSLMRKKEVLMKYNGRNRIEF